MLEDLNLLRDEVGQLRMHTEQSALFATALFDLERARRGDPDARSQLLEVADSLLIFWREQTGDALADTHPALGPLWAHASALLVSFEIKRFKRALDACWEARTDAALLQVAIEGLHPAENRRVDFAACLYHLELARLSVDSSRQEFARRASLVHEAYHSKETADELVGNDPGLQHLWTELVPYLDEFFEALEAEQERKLRSSLKTDPVGETAVPRAAPPPEVAPPEEPSLPPAPPELTEPKVAVTFVGPTPTARDREAGADPTDPSSKALIESIDLAAPLPDAPPPPPGDTSGVFDLWLQEPNRPSVAPVSAVIESIEEVFEPIRNEPPPPPSNFTPAPGTLLALQFPDPDVTAPAPARPPPPPANFTPAPGTLEALELPNPDVTAPRPPPGPPPPPNTTPIPGRMPVGHESGILDLQDLVEDEAPAPRPSLDVGLGGYEPDAAAQTFWRHTEAALGLLPPAAAPRMTRRALSAEGRTERKKLNGWLEGVDRRFNTVPESRTFACLMKLYLAAQLKEKGLFGGANTKRKEAFVAALELLSAEPLAAAHCAVWFELDGKETLEHLGNGLEVLTDYLQYCARQNLDPLDPSVPAQFLG